MQHRFSAALLAACSLSLSAALFCPGAHAADAPQRATADIPASTVNKSERNHNLRDPLQFAPAAASHSVSSTPIPEPATSWMVLAGFAVLGLFASRSQHHS